MADPQVLSAKGNRLSIETGVKGDRAADSRPRIVDRFAECDLTVIQVKIVMRCGHDQRSRLAIDVRRALILVCADIDRVVRDACSAGQIGGTGRQRIAARIDCR